MRLGLFLILPQPEGRTQQQVFAGALADARLAEQLGFDTVWVTEHHGSEYGLCASPSVLAAAIAAQTNRIAIGYAVAVTPLHHPVRLAEELAMVDQLSGGRLVAGFGPGYAEAEFAHLGLDYSQRHAAHGTGLASVVGHWATGGGVSPLQRPRPPVAVTAASPDTAAWAAREGYDVLALVGDDHLAQLRSALAAGGSRISVLRSVSAVHNHGQRAAVDAATRWTLQLRNRMLGQPPPAPEEVTAYLAARGIVGTAADVADAVLRHQANGIDELICWARWGGLADEQVHGTMRVLAGTLAGR